MQVVQEPAAFADQAQKSAPRMMVLRVGLQVLGQLLDTRTEQRHLDFGRTAVRGCARVGLDNFQLRTAARGIRSLLLPFSFLVNHAAYQRGPGQ